MQQSPTKNPLNHSKLQWASTENRPIHIKINQKTHLTKANRSNHLLKIDCTTSWICFHQQTTPLTVNRPNCWERDRGREQFAESTNNINADWTDWTCKPHINRKKHRIQLKTNINSNYIMPTIVEKFTNNRYAIRWSLLGFYLPFGCQWLSDL